MKSGRARTLNGRAVDFNASNVAPCCCGGGGPGCFGATQCCGAGTGCGILTPASQVALTSLAFTGTASGNIRIVYLDEGGRVESTSATMDFSPSRIPATWLAPGAIIGLCFRQLSAPRFQWSPSPNQKYHDMSWTVNLSAAARNYAVLNYSQEHYGIWQQSGQPTLTGGFNVSSFTLGNHPEDATARFVVGGGGRGSPAIPLALLSSSRAGSCTFGAKYRIASTGSDFFENFAFRIDWAWNVAVDMEAIWNLCACTSGRPCVDCGEEGAL